MAYTKTVHKDRQVQYPSRYVDQESNQYTFTRDEGTVTEEGTLVNATVLNNMEDGIEFAVTTTKPTATINGDYKCTTTGVTLEAGQCYKMLFPAPTDGTKNARLSVDNGVNYKNIKFFDGTQVLASEIETTYQKMYYNGTDLILLCESYSRTTASGTYTRYKDGTMINTVKINVNNVNVNQTAGALKYALVNATSFPSTFNRLDSIVCFGTGSSSTFWVANGSVPSTSSTGNFILYADTAKVLSAGSFISIQAVGRWKA